MISFRYHIASLVAVLLALAAGVALGSGPLDETTGSTQAKSGNGPRAASAEANTVGEFNTRFAASLTTNLITDRLDGRTVTMLVLPGAAPAEVLALTEALGVAGATLTGTFQIGQDLVDASKKQLVDELGAQLEVAATKVAIEADASTYERVGTLLAYAVGTTTAKGDAPDQQAQGILAGLSTASLISSDDELKKRGSLVLVVGGEPVRESSLAGGTGSIVDSLVKAIDARTGGVVVSGPASSAGATGVLTAIRTDASASKSVSTVDSLESPAGVIVSVLALAEQASKKAGQYGAGTGSTGPRPGITND